MANIIDLFFTHFSPGKKIQVELPTRKVSKILEDPAASSEKDLSQEQPELNGMKRKRPQTTVPEIPPKGIFSSAVFKIHSETPLLLSPKRRKSQQGKRFEKIRPQSGLIE